MRKTIIIFSAFIAISCSQTGKVLITNSQLIEEKNAYRIECKSLYRAKAIKRRIERNQSCGPVYRSYKTLYPSIKDIECYYWLFGKKYGYWNEHELNQINK